MKTAAERARVAYTMSRFPKLTETFVLDEILELERQGVRVEVFPLWRERAHVVHPEAVAVVERAHFLPALDLEILRDVCYWLVRAPRRLLETLWTIVWANRTSVRYLLGALAVLPKACTMSRRMQVLGVRHVHAHFASHPAAAAYAIGRLTGLPWSFTAHGSDLHREQAMLAEKVGSAKFVVAISEYNRRFILEHTSPAYRDKVRVVHCGVDVTAFEASDPTVGGLDVVCIGTLHEVKGQRYLLEACARIAADAGAWHCHLVGDGPDRRALEALARDLGIADRVTFHGSCERERVRALLKTMTTACAPSVPTADGRREGIPVALMEAAACGLPLVASRLSGIPELVQHDVTGLLTEPRDVDGLARALTTLALEPGTRRRLGSAARELVRRDFSLSGGVARLESLMLSETLPCSR